MTGLKRLRESLSPCACALVFSSVSRQYLTGFRSSDGTLLVTENKSYLFLDSRYFEMACLAKAKGRIPAEVELCSSGFGEFFSELLERGEVKTVLFEDRCMTVFELKSLETKYKKASFLPLGRRIEEMRVIKSEEEIRKIAAAQELAEDAFAYILPRLKVGREEREVAADLEYFMKKNGASGPSFGTICVSGTRSSLPHGTPTDAPLEKNTFLTMDFGAILDGYASDMTRTVCIGKADEEMKRVYETVLAAQMRAIAAVKSGVKGKVVDAAARDVITKAGYGECFGHSTGHGIGLEVHEAPSFSPKAEGEIPGGAVLSVEPGIYLPGKFGVRIEDLVVVREGGCDDLNRSSKLLMEL